MGNNIISAWTNAVPGATLTKSVACYYKWGRIIGVANYYSDGTVKYFGTVPHLGIKWH